MGRVSPRRVAIVGAGHVGVVYAAGLSELGHRVQVVDIDRRRVASLRRGRLWFHEPGLPELLGRGLRSRRIVFTTDYGAALNGAQFVFVCVPSPTTADGGLDASYLRAAYDRIRAAVRPPLPIVVNKSTVPVGTGDSLTTTFGTGIHVVSNPEFLAEGRAIKDFFKPARILLGARDRSAAEAVASLYAPLRANVVYTDPLTAEFSKLAANAFLAMKISFANAISAIGSGLGVDAVGLAQTLSADPRIGPGHLRPGLGFGGSCLPKDLAAMEQLAGRVGTGFDLFEAVAAVNRGQRARVIDIVRGRLGCLADKQIAILGAAYKANTDDLRGSIALLLASELDLLKSRVSLFDPAAGRQLRMLQRNELRVARSALAAARGADCVIIATDWPEFANLDLRAIKRVMRGNLIVDGRGIISPEAARAAGFEIFTFAGETPGSARFLQCATRTSPVLA